MIKAEPRTILSFLHANFDVVKDLFSYQIADGLITKEVYDMLIQKHGHTMNIRLREYRVIRSLGSDYEMRDVYFKLMEFLMFEFKPLLPETIEKYKGSISELFLKIRKYENQDRDILQERIKNLSHQVREFVDLVERNTFRLLAETRELKSNIDRIEYREKVQKASFWIEYYILPLNRILDVKHSESVTSTVLDVSEYANRRRLDFQDETIRMEFEKLYAQLIQTNTDLLRQSKVLVNELLPLNRSFSPAGLSSCATPTRWTLLLCSRVRAPWYTRKICYTRFANSSSSSPSTTTLHWKMAWWTSTSGSSTAICSKVTSRRVYL
jgi:hypothetical protein